MRDEEIDWCVYRLIADGDTDAVSGILDCTQFEIPVVEASLARLMRAGLITREENHLCILPFQGTLVHAQTRYEDSPIYLEHGVIRYRKDRENRI